jgi:hypothetical protein
VRYELTWLILGPLTDGAGCRVKSKKSYRPQVHRVAISRCLAGTMIKKPTIWRQVCLLKTVFLGHRFHLNFTNLLPRIQSSYKGICTL